MTAGIGHNSGMTTDERLRSYADRITQLREEVKGLNEDIKDVKAEAKSHGYDVKQLMKAISLREQDIQKVREESEVLKLYLHALGMHDIAEGL
jgi:uncharacterized protein (UPF0335 family)